MKKSTKVSSIWTTTTRDATKPGVPFNKNNTRNVQPWPSATSATSLTDKPSTNTASDKDKLSLADLEEELEQDTKDVSLVDQEERKQKKTTRASWADVVKNLNLSDKAFSDTVSMQGLGPIFDPKSSLKRKGVWFTIVFVAILFTTFNIYTQIVMYVDRPITVRVDFKKASDLQFPSITICNNNFAGYNATAGFVNGVQTLKIVKPLLFTTADNSSADFSAYNFTKYHIVGWEVFFALLSQDMDDMLLMCKWEQSPCSLANFTPVFTDMGLCYSFNVNGSLAAREAGRSFGLKLTLDAKQDDYLRSMDHYYGAGFRVVVHAPGVPPIMSERGVAVSPGLHNFLAIDVKQLKNAEPSISQCGSKKLKYYRTTYSTEACRLECRTDVISDTCGCRDLYMPNSDVRICDPPEFHTCLYPTLDEYLKSGNHCEDLCPEPCQENLYRVTPSSNPLSGRFLDEFSTVMGHDPQYWRSNLVHLEIYLTSMTYEKVEKQLGYTLLQLFCDVGGAFGLLLGASLLTLLEIVDFFLCRISAGGNGVVNSAGKR